MIKEVTKEELPVAAEAGKRFFVESSIPGKLVSDVFVKNWSFFLDNGMGKIFGVYENEAMVGAIGGIIAPDLNDGEICATEAFWFVTPENRGSGIKLLLHFIKYAEEIGCVRLNMVHLFNEHADKLSKLYKKKGFSPVEVHYVLTL